MTRCTGNGDMAASRTFGAFAWFHPAMTLYAKDEFGFIDAMSRRCILLVLAAVLFCATDVFCQNDYKRIFDEDNIPPVHELMLSGRYDLVERLCETAIRRGQPSVEWQLMRFESMAALGRAREAWEEAQTLLLGAYGKDLRTLIAVRRLALRIGEKKAADDLLDRLNEAALTVPEKDRSAADLVALGQAALALGADPATVLEQYFEKAKRAEPGYIDAYIAAGELALGKSDFARAAKEFQAGLKFSAGHPELHFGVARAFFPSDRNLAMASVRRVVERNPMHAGALLFQAELLIDKEYYKEAETILQQVLTHNAMESPAWAYRAALAELARNDAGEAEVHRSRALAEWSENPEIDYLIGRVLSRNYRFAEGARHQRLALGNDGGFLPAKIQLAHDLLRLGEEDEAWKLADEVATADPYNVLAYNLTVLRDEMKNFRTVESPEFTLRMPSKEVEIYGDRALELLIEAREVLCEKYGLTLDQPVLVEFFPHQQDFAIRTFGNLGGGGILGACFGTVVTMNSPGGLAANRNNWEATLWHEFCHVVTLTVTKNKMPRWLSEGISVYEETQRDPTWGEHLTPRYREMILVDDDLTPISELSGAFLNPKSGEHLMFAYYQAGLVVEYVIERFGIEAFRDILKDLAEGVLINDAIARQTMPIDQLQEEFAQHAAVTAKNLAPGVLWGAPPTDALNPRDPVAVAAFVKSQPKSFWARQKHTLNLVAAEDWQAAVESADELIGLHPAYTEANNGYALKAAALRALGRHDDEAAALRQLAEKSAEALAAYDRLMELDLEKENWPELELNAKRTLAINPFSKRLHYCAGCAHEAQQEKAEAVRSFEKLLILKPANPSETRFRLARLQREDEPELARRYLLDALADAPRYRDAHRLLLAMATGEEPAPAPAPTTGPGKTVSDPFVPAPAGGAMAPPAKTDPFAPADPTTPAGENKP